MSDDLNKTLKAAASSGIKLLFDPGVVALNQAIELEERPPAKSQSQLIFAISALIVFALLWMASTRVDIVTSAAGRIAPAGELVAVQHLEGGAIAEIMVGEGEHVAKGQPLVRLAALDTEGHLEQLKAKRAAHLLAVEGDRAIFEGRAPSFDKIVAGFADQKADQSALYKARMEAFAAQRTVLTAQREQRVSEVDRLTAQLMVLRRGGGTLDLPWGVIAGAFAGFVVSATVAALFLVAEMVKTRGLMPVLMKRRNKQQWSAEDKAEIRAHLSRLSRLSPYLVILVMPGGFAILPVLAWWLDRRRLARARAQSA